MDHITLLVQIVGALALIVAIVVGYHFSSHTKKRIDQNEARETRTFHDANIERFKARIVHSVPRELRSLATLGQLSIASFDVPPQDVNDRPVTHLPYYFAASCLYFTHRLEDYDPTVTLVPEVDELVTFELAGDNVVRAIEHLLPILGYASYFVVRGVPIERNIWLSNSTASSPGDIDFGSFVSAANVPEERWHEYRFGLLIHEDCVIWVHKVEI